MTDVSKSSEVWTDFKVSGLRDLFWQLQYLCLKTNWLWVRPESFIYVGSRPHANWDFRRIIQQWFNNSTVSLCYSPLIKLLDEWTRCKLLLHHIPPLFSVVNQFYEAEVVSEYVIKGNTAVLKCNIPSFVTDFVKVDAWVASDGEEYLPRPDFGTGYVCWSQPYMYHPSSDFHN